MWSTNDYFPIETKTYLAPSAKDIWQKLPAHFRPENLTEEQLEEESPEGYAVIWIEENPG